MAEVIVTAAAEVEYLESLLWYLERSHRAAEGFETEFDRAIQAISEEPDRFPVCADGHRALLRRRYPFQIVYRRERDVIVVIAVAHAKRKPNYWADR